MFQPYQNHPFFTVSKIILVVKTAFLPIEINNTQF